MAMLEVENIHSYYGSIHALKGISLSVEKGEIVTLIGANGAGKSTTLRTITGLMKPTLGRIFLDGEDITPLKAHVIVEKGVAMVPEGRRIFARLTVAENLDMGAFIRDRKDIPGELARVFSLFPRLKERINQVAGTLSGGEQQMLAMVPEGRRIFARLTVAENLDMGAFIRDRKDIPGELARVFSLFPRLKERINQVAGTLSGGEQQMLAMARAMMTHPRVLLMDEPSMGLAPVLVEAIFETIQLVNKQEGTTVLLVEQNAQMALSVASRGYVLETGNIVLSDKAENLRTNESVQKAYLGIE